MEKEEKNRKNDSVGHRIRVARWSADMTQEELAAELNRQTLNRYSRYKIMNIEHDKREITGSEAEDIAKVLGVTPEYLIFGWEGGKCDG